MSVRGLAGKAVSLDDAIADWRSEIVSRLELAGVRPRWHVTETSETPVLSARNYMQLTRILREAISNVIKHSGAEKLSREVHIRRRLPAYRRPGRWPWHRARPEPKARAWRGMKRRAKRLNGQCLVESSPGHGVVISLTVPV